VLEDSVRRLDLHLTVVLPDVVVDCFRMSVQSVEGAAAVARSIKSQRRRADPARAGCDACRARRCVQGGSGRDYARHLFHAALAELGLEHTRFSTNDGATSLVGRLRRGVDSAEDAVAVYGDAYGAGEGLEVCPCRASMWCWSGLCRRCGCLVSLTGRTTAGRIRALRPRRSRRARCRVSG
jgi:hypothetical protein